MSLFRYDYLFNGVGSSPPRTEMVYDLNINDNENATFAYRGAVLQDNWKLITDSLGRGRLYDVFEDERERRDMSGQRPDILLQLFNMMLDYGDFVVFPDDPERPGIDATKDDDDNIITGWCDV